MDPSRAAVCCANEVESRQDSPRIFNYMVLQCLSATGLSGTYLIRRSKILHNIHYAKLRSFLRALRLACPELSFDRFTS